MISIYVKAVDATWFAVAYSEERIVATAVSSTRERALRSLLLSLPLGVEHKVIEEGSDFAKKTILMLKELHAGNEESKSFTLADEFISETVARVLKIAAAIPIGYVTSYGNIAKAANTEPRVIGQMMAKNPLYPIVPCHRVVGADFSLVGYGGRKSRQALQAKLHRLKNECRGFTNEREARVNGETLRVYPVESVIKKARNEDLNSHQQKLFDNRKS